MSTAFYNRMKGTADRLLSKYGTTIQVLDANRAVLGVFEGLLGPLRVENTPASVIEQAQATIYMTAGTMVPDVEHFIQHDGELWKVIYVEAARPTDITLLYTIFVRK